MKITMKRNKKDYSENKINVYQICLVALAVGINIVGGQIALFMKLPVYLDSIGTILTGAVLGPWFGMLPNLISGIFMGMTVDIYSLYFAPVGMITGIMSGLVFRKLSVKKVKVLFLGIGSMEGPGTKNFHEALSKIGVKSIYYESPGTAHEWLTWRRCLYNFAPMLFKN